LGARFSWDRCAEPSPAAKQSSYFLSWGTAALLLQSAAVYFITAVQKWPGIPWHDGTAIYYALNIDTYVTRFGRGLLLFPSLLKFLTHAVLWFELLCPFLLFCPVLTIPLRTGAALAVIFMHLNFFFSMRLGLFSMMSASSMILFFPGVFWDRWLPSTLAHARHFVRGHGDSRYARIVRDFHYLRNRWLPRTGRAVDVRQSAGSAALVIFFFLITAWRCLGMLCPAKISIPGWVNQIGVTAYTDQAWRLFAPEPLRSGGWYVIAGRLNDGSQVDLLRGGASLSWAKPISIAATFKNERWRKLLVNLGDRKYPTLLAGYENYLCRSWNESQDSSSKLLNSFDMVFMSKTTPADDRVEIYKKIVIARVSCARDVRPRFLTKK
jgi:hypothetical protein